MLQKELEPSPKSAHLCISIGIETKYLFHYLFNICFCQGHQQGWVFGAAKRIGALPKVWSLLYFYRNWNRVFVWLFVSARVRENEILLLQKRIGTLPKVCLAHIPATEFILKSRQSILSRRPICFSLLEANFYRFTRTRRQKILVTQKTKSILV